MTKKVGVDSEIRQDLITGKWVVMAKARGKRPHDAPRVKQPVKTLAKFKQDCPFCALDKFPQEPDRLRLPDDDQEWQVHIFPNKYPALLPKDELKSWMKGPYRGVEAVGYHEVLATRWHNQEDGSINRSELAYQVEALVRRYRQLREEPTVNYIQIIKNKGVEAGQSLEHPHWQIFTIPVLPSDVMDMLKGAEDYARIKQQEVFQVIVDHERSVGERLVWENEKFVVFCPYASRVPYEMWIVPREANPFFENIGLEEQELLTEALQQVWRRLAVVLEDPPYNVYLHSAPCDEGGFVCDQRQFKHFRWHIQILPRLVNWGGFELGTGVEINSVLPEAAAEVLRGQRIVIKE
jgi:UDPglucose--hexose-1-phosphate uridylyltransferase